jgi:hypothetical protein
MTLAHDDQPEMDASSQRIPPTTDESLFTDNATVSRVSFLSMETVIMLQLAFQQN